MYEELIAALNAADKRPCSDLECPGSGECPTVGCLFREAADAIEHLEDLIHRYKDICDKMAGNIDKLRGLCKELYYRNKTNTIIPADKEVTE